MRNRAHIALLSILMLVSACIREDLPTYTSIPEGSPVTLTIGFGATTPVEVNVETKAEATRADESRIHDLYVLIFDTTGDSSSSTYGKRSYGRYFNYEHRWNDMTNLKKTTDESEGWYVRNKTEGDMVDPLTGSTVAKTVGAVKIATTALSNCTMVLLANVSNTLISLDGEDPLDKLNSITKLSELRTLSVRLEQNVVERSDLFLMAGQKEGLDMTNMKWYDDDSQLDDSSTSIGSNYQVNLSPLDAKVKFRIKAVDGYIKDLVTYKWSVSNVPSSCYLLPENPNDYSIPAVSYSFDTTPIFFDGDEEGYKTFSFYMLESCLTASNPIPSDELKKSSGYYLREKQEKNDAVGGYVTNGDWIYAPAKAPYVTFSVSFSLDENAINAISNLDSWTGDAPHGASGEITYTVHLGDFSQTTTQGGDTIHAWNDYNTRRGHFYTYDILLKNATSLFVEVKNYSANKTEIENQPGQEGSLLLFSGGRVNCDAHYEYQMIEFKFNQALWTRMNDPSAQGYDQDYHLFSWSVSTPFTKNGKPHWVQGERLIGFYQSCKREGRMSTRPEMDMLILGNSGTGKSYLVNLVHQQFLEKGILSNPRIKKVDASEYNQWINTVNESTLAAMKGQLLLIDNVHLLMSDTEHLTPIDRLLSMMEDWERDAMAGWDTYPIVIFAGDKSIVEYYFQKKKNGRSRFALQLELRDCSAADLHDICRLELEKFGLTLSPEADKKLKGYFRNVIKNRKVTFRNAYEATEKADAIYKLCLEHGHTSEVQPDDISGEIYVEQTPDEILARLDEFVGIDDVKREMHSIVENIKQYRAEHNDPNALPKFRDQFVFLGGEVTSNNRAYSNSRAPVRVSFFVAATSRIPSPCLRLT